MGSSQRISSSSDSDFLGITSTLERHNNLARGRHPLLTGSVRQHPSRGSTRPAPSTADGSWHPGIQQPSVSSAYPTEASSLFDTPYDRPTGPISISEETDATSVLGSDTASDVQSLGEPPGTDELTIPCEFAPLTDCNWRFRLSEIDSWLIHVKGVHLHGLLPDETWCWFCDEVQFKATLRRDAEREACFHQRIYHIVDHMRNDTNVDQLRIRPDFPLLDHLAKHKLITQEAFNRAKNYSEMPENLQQRVQRPSSPKPSPRDVVRVTHHTNSKRQRHQSYHT